MAQARDGRQETTQAHFCTEAFAAGLQAGRVSPVMKTDSQDTCPHEVHWLGARRGEPCLGEGQDRRVPAVCPIPSWPRLEATVLL